MADVVTVPGATDTRPRRPAADRATSPVGWVLRVLAVLWVAVLVLVPLVIILKRAFQPGLSTFFDALADPDAQHAFQVTAVVAGSAVVIDVVFGVAAAVLLARYRFPGRRLLSAFIDLPVAVSPIIVGLALVLVYGPQGWFGDALTDTPLQIINAKPGMVLATVFVSLPMVVRAVEPVLTQAGTEQEQAASSLGANAAQRFVRITLPTIRIALLYGTVLAIARCLGEYGAVLIVSGNVAGVSETAPLLIGNLIDNEQDYDSAYAVASVLVLIALAAIALSALIRRWGRSR
ncbi:sulfate transport system permease protein [Jatrophihabitans endophyticus]|uniref:Sulfate transport system permease protein n=1 Tax=Jatrophihabitans endophyticus TaxID=1206085 RepID=A0A1M5MHT2_9ACTN|nr:sulfate ABC transporter permease subunit [Jatrophihabitans endophyticus]SHG76898.1 sulfate transport system permease protein [Jatrophihabitans endophyticus]